MQVPAAGPPSRQASGRDAQDRAALAHVTSLAARDVQGSNLMRQAIDSDSALLLGGDLLVSVREVLALPLTAACIVLPHMPLPGLCLGARGD